MATMMQLIEGQFYNYGGAQLQALRMCNTWVLMVMENGEFGTKPCGALAAYRLVEGQWREMFVDPDYDDQLVWGAVVDIDLATLYASSVSNDATDERFASLMADLAWEWS